MAHRSWYRKYRPQTFDDVVGQSHIERTLRNAVEEGAVAHAYLFTGPRGTGKTTTARILAKALDCQQGPTGQPDDACEDCRLIAEGQHPDVHELDAASRTGVDAVREEIIGRVNYAPTRGRYKVYIIDEVHMLSNAAFNALLKTLEEPPPQTVFVLCTTHPHKVPETIHSRCQRFDFHRLGVEDIVGRLRHIADAEGVTVSDAALTLIARHALGGMRDAITTLEQLAAFGSGTITLEDVEGLLGEVDSETLFTAADIIARRDIAEAFRFIESLAEQGVDMTEFVSSFTRHARDLFVAAVLPDVGDALDATAAEKSRIVSQARAFGVERLARMLDVLDRLATELRYAGDQRLALEVALVRLARPDTEVTLESLAERVAALEGAAGVGAFARGSASPASGVTAADPAARATIANQGPAESAEPVRADERVTVVQANPEGTVAHAAGSQPQGRLDLARLRRAWPAVIAEFRKLKPSRSHLFDAIELEVSGDAIIIEFPRHQAFALELARDAHTLGVLKRSIACVLDIDPPIEFKLGRQGSSGVPTEAVEASAEVQDEMRERQDAGSPASIESVDPVVAEGFGTSGDEGDAGGSDVPVDDIERRLQERFGARLIEERTVEDDT